MNPILSQCPHQNDDIVLSDLRTQLNFIELKTLTDECAAFFAAIKARVVASRLDNSIAWVVLDLALMTLERTHLPIPQFFTDAQLAFATREAGCQLMVSDTRLLHAKLITQMTLLSQTLYVYELDNSERPLHPGTQKITFTSGSTGQPKGVCLSLNNQLTVAQSLTQRIGLTKPVHMTILPFPVLLENVAGLYAPLLAGGKIVVLPSEQIGFSGASLKNPKMLLASMTNINPHSMILVPELLKVLVAARSQGWSLPSNLTFIAVGGAHTPKALLQQAKELGLPVYQGYGLSEAGSVVALNTEEQDGSVGKVLEHIQYRVVNAELQIKGPLFLGYLGQTAHNANCWLSTGDLVEVERERVFIAGREKNLIISSLGRNISPEWPETELLSASWLVQCVVFGEAKPNLCALIYAMPVVPDVLITQHIATINQSLPEYAQIKHYLRLSTPLSVEAGLLTANGRPKRAAIEAAYKQQIEMLYTASPSAQQRLA